MLWLEQLLDEPEGLGSLLILPKYFSFIGYIVAGMKREPADLKHFSVSTLE